MRTLLLIFNSLVLISCKTYSISQTEKEQLISELSYIAKIDQEYAGIPPQEWKDKYGYEKAWEIFQQKRDSVFLNNQFKIKSMYKRFGYLGFDKVGVKASNDFWIIVQHADNDVKFQKRILKSMKKEVPKNNVNKADYALLEDRVNVNLGKKQRFGTQVTYSEKGQALPKNGLTDSLKVDELRKEYNLPMYKDYLNFMTKEFFEMNREAMIKQGITTPQLY